jgi:porin
MKKSGMLWLVAVVMGVVSSAGAEEALSLRHEKQLFGDMGGLRPWLAGHGVQLDVTYTSEVFSNLSGGVKDDDATRHRGDLSIGLTLDTEAAGWWEDGTFFVHLQGQHGAGISEDFTGDFQVLSNIDADDFFQVSEFWYEHQFLEERLRLKLGKMEANSDFAGPEYGSEFLNSSGGVAPTIPLVTFPDQDWGVVLGLKPNARFSMNLGLYQGRPDGGRSLGSTLNNLYGPMAMAEAALHFNLGGHPGTLRIGAWWHGDKAEDLETGALRDDTTGGYAIFDQALWKEHPDDGEDEQGLGLFLQYGASPDRYYEAEGFYGGGLQWIGPFGERDDDVLGLGVFHAVLSDKGGFDEDSETAIEVFYKFQVLGWLTAKPDIQYIIHPGGTDHDNALAAGLRCEFSF